MIGDNPKRSGWRGSFGQTHAREDRLAEIKPERSNGVKASRRESSVPRRRKRRTRPKATAQGHDGRATEPRLSVRPTAKCVGFLLNADIGADGFSTETAQTSRRRRTRLEKRTKGVGDAEERTDRTARMRRMGMAEQMSV